MKTEIKTEFKMVVCAGRHPVPENDGAIFPVEVENIFDFDGLYRTADENIPLSCTALALIVTGLTPCTLAIAKVCHDRGIKLTALHYNRADGEYYPQQC